VRDREDACPGTVDAAVGDDGLIARVRLPGGRLSGPQLRVIADCAAELGTGCVDLTVRANVQLRGLSEGGLRTLAVRLADAGLLPSPSHDRVRNILAGPFAGRDPGALVDADLMTGLLDAALCAAPELAALPGRFQFVIDDGGWPVAAPRHDVALVAVAPGVVELRLAGSATGRFASDASDAVGLALAAARVFMRERAASGAWHVRELPGGAAQLADALTTESGPKGLAPRPTGPRFGGGEIRRVPRASTPVIGCVTQADGRSAVSALVPLGRLTHGQLTVLADLVAPAHADAAKAPHSQAASAHDTARLRLTPWRGVWVRDITPTDVPRVVAALETAGLPTDPDSAWRGVSACSGVGECRRAAVDVRALAREFAAERRSGWPGAVHFAACGRACGRPAGSALVVAEEPPGRAPEYRLAVGTGRPRDADALRRALAVLRPSVRAVPAEDELLGTADEASDSAVPSSAESAGGPVHAAPPAAPPADAPADASAPVAAGALPAAAARPSPPSPDSPERHPWTSG
jgi:precorrin-3B synthase